MLKRNDPCFCGSGKKWKKCHAPALPESTHQILTTRYAKSYGIMLKTEEQIEGIRKSGHLAAHILDEVCKMAKAGVTTEELNTYANKLHKEAGATPAPLGYGEPPFPKSICTSLNEVICHGIPGPTVLKDGDILNIDVTCILDGYYGDCSQMVAIGEISEEKQRVMDVSYECLMKSIEILKPGVFVHEIGKAISDHAEEKNCSVVTQFVGHGVGIDFHEAPQIPHHYNSVAIPLAEGMTFTIEPMINAGVSQGSIDTKDHWTARTLDGKASAQWEHTILITKTGYELLTPWKRK
jgi:methionyl aminopeptidase